MPFALRTRDLNGLCIPDLKPLFDAADESINKTSALFGKNMSAAVFIDESIADLRHTWAYIVGFLTGTMALIGFAGYSYNDLKDKPGADLPLMDVPYQYWDSNANFWLYLTIVASCVFVIMLLITIGLRKRIKGAISVMKIASSALASAPLTAVFPVFPFLLS